MASPLQIRPYVPADWPALWALLEPVFREGETFPHDPAISEAEAQLAWVQQNQAVMIAVDGAGALVGTYYLRPNSLALGAHVANAGYVVAEHCRRQGIGSLDSGRCSSTWWLAPTVPVSVAGSATAFRSSVLCRERFATGSWVTSMPW